jgi:hypothetical protein
MACWSVLGITVFALAMGLWCAISGMFSSQEVFQAEFPAAFVLLVISMLGTAVFYALKEQEERLRGLEGRDRESHDVRP